MCSTCTDAQFSCVGDPCPPRCDFQCLTVDVCVDADEVCDGNFQCPDRSDERDCGEQIYINIDVLDYNCNQNYVKDCQLCLSRHLWTAYVYVTEVSLLNTCSNYSTFISEQKHHTKY